jgi:hypothetical protein
MRKSTPHAARSKDIGGAVKARQMRPKPRVTSRSRLGITDEM